jgi:hypothetical protein
MLCNAGFTSSTARIPAEAQKRDAGNAPARAARALVVVVFTYLLLESCGVRAQEDMRWFERAPWGVLQ